MKYLYLPIEIITRELESKLLLAVGAANQGWLVVLGKKTYYYSNVRKLPKGVFIIKSAVPSELSYLKEMRSAGHRIVCLDEEGVVTFPEFIGSDVRFSKATLEQLDRIYTWGSAQRKILLDQYPAEADKLRVTGNPRLDLWRGLSKVIFAERVNQIKEVYGEYVLIPTSFGIGNNFMKEVASGLSHTLAASGRTTDEIRDFMVGQAEQNAIVFREYIDVLPALLIKHFNVKFIIRPHPSESSEPYEKLAKDFENLSVVYDGAVAPWIHAAKCVFHFKSTTSIEAYYAKKPTITYIPPLPPCMDRYELPIPNIFSSVCRSRESLFKAFEIVLTNQDSPLGICERDLSFVSEWIEPEATVSCTERILEDLDFLKVEHIRPERLPRSARADWIGLVKVVASILKRTVSRRHRDYFKIAAKYGHHKFGGLSDVDVEAIVKIIQEAIKGTPAIRVTRLSSEVISVATDDSQC
jgi:surface carbohydrate biosynthesis protein